jgi:hypothetical protein
MRWLECTGDSRLAPSLIRRSALYYSTLFLFYCILPRKITVRSSLWLAIISGPGSQERVSLSLSLSLSLSHTESKAAHNPTHSRRASCSISLKTSTMILLDLAFAIFVSHLLALVVADSDNYFVHPPQNPNYSSYAPNVAFGTFKEGASITLQWVTTWDSVHILLSQNNNPIPLPLPNSRMSQNTAKLTQSYFWTVMLTLSFRKSIRHLVIHMDRGPQWGGR